MIYWCTGQQERGFSETPCMTSFFSLFVAVSTNNAVISDGSQGDCIRRIYKLTSNLHFLRQAKPNFCPSAVSNLDAWSVKTKLYLNRWALGLLKSTAEQLLLKYLFLTSLKMFPKDTIGGHLSERFITQNNCAVQQRLWNQTICLSVQVWVRGRKYYTFSIKIFKAQPFFKLQEAFLLALIWQNGFLSEAYSVSFWSIAGLFTVSSRLICSTWRPTVQEAKSFCGSALFPFSLHFPLWMAQLYYQMMADITVNIKYPSYNITII